MKQLYVSRAMVAVAAFVAAVVWAQGDVPVSTAGKDTPASDTVRAAGAGKSDGVDAKDVPPAWVVSSTGTVARAEAGDAGAMEEIANGYFGLASSSNKESTDDERMAMIQEAAKWMQRRAKVIVKAPEMLARAEKGDEAAMMDLARSFLSLAAARTMEARGEERRAMFQKAMGWLRRRTEKAVTSDDADAIEKVANEITSTLSSTEFNLNEEEQGALGREIDRLTRRCNKIMADREGDVESVRKRAEAGDPAAQRALGFRYSHGVDVEKDPKKGLKWTKRAVEQGDARAMLDLADAYVDGDGVAKDDAKAIALYRKAAKVFLELAKKDEKLDLRLLRHAGEKLLYEESLSVPDVGMIFLGIAAKCGDAEAMRIYGAEFVFGHYEKKDINKGLLWLQKAVLHGDESASAWIWLSHQSESDRLLLELHDKADAGDKEAAARFGECMKLLTGDRPLGRIESSALAGHVPSQAQLGLAYMLGRSVGQDKAKAVEWLRKAVDQGEYRAMLWLGTAYEHGQGVAKDDWRAFDLWRRSHELGWDPATEKLHSLSDEYRKEAEKGNASAQFFMGVVHEYGYAGKPDAAKAVEWYRKSAEQGHSGAMFNLGTCYLEGTGVKKNIAEATKWFKRAASLGHERSAKILEKLQKEAM